MIITSVYKEMETSARRIPNGNNVKMILRHSYRPSLKGVANPDDAPLTKAGKTMAYNFGKGLEYEIGTVYSSNSLRCRDTLNHILLGANSSSIPINMLDMRYFYAEDINQSMATFQTEGNGKQVILKLSRNITLPGFYSIKECAKRQLQLFFESGGLRNKVDIYCTHDFQIMCLIVALFNNVYNLDDVKRIWPNMLEGLFIWGSKDDFYCVWRNAICNVKNYNF